MKGLATVVKAVVVTTAVYTWFAVQAGREVRYALSPRPRQKYAQRPIDF